jgi:glycosyltransferase involved in cell wall biosynthesis
LFLGNLVGQLASRRRAVPVVSNLVLSGNLELLRTYQPGAGSRKAALLRRIAGWAARRANVSFRALTEEVKESNAALLGVDPARVSVIPRGVPVPETAPSRSRTELGLPDGPLVVNVGRLAAQKGQALLVEAFAIARRDVPQAGLVVVGRDGEARAEVDAAIRRFELTGAVTLVGHSTRVADYLREGHVFAFSSLMEGLGTSVLEAMAVGIPVVAFDIPPVREASADGRYATLIPVGDVPALAAALAARLGADKEVDTEARDWVRGHHDMQRIASLVEDLLRAATSVTPTAG